jgi:hypothetical protein
MLTKEMGYGILKMFFLRELFFTGEIKMKKVSLLLLLACLFAGVLNAEIINIQVTAEITQFEDYGSYFDDSVYVGSILTLTYNYNTETQVEGDFPNVNGYYTQTSDKDINVAVGNYSFERRSDSLYQIEISNQPSYDMYSVYSEMIPGTDLFVNLQVSYDSSFFDSTKLPSVAPDISLMESGRIQLMERGVFEIRATPISAQVIPEPATLLTLGLGCLIVRFKIS